MYKYIITLFTVLTLCCSTQAFAQQEYHYKIYKTYETDENESNRYEPFYYETVHPKDKLFTKKKKERAWKSVDYYPNGNIKSIFYSYKKGRNFNPIPYMTKRYHPNGMIAEDSYINPFKSELWGYRNTFYDNGQLESTVCRVGVAYIIGIKRNFHRNGQLASRGWYKGFMGDSGQELGPWSYYHDNGQLAAEGSYTNHFSKEDTGARSEKRGEWKYYNENGELIKTENF